jgi:SdrD B-like domain/Ig-like domain CHU_C associated/HYR domain
MSNFTRWLSENDSPSRLLLPPNNWRDSLASLFSVQGKRSRPILSVAFAVLMAVFFSQSSFAQELIVNPGFESKLVGWQSNQNPIKTIAATNPVKTGTYAAHINNNNSAAGDEYFHQNVSAAPFGKYTFSVWAMTHDASKYGSVGVNVYDANWAKIPAACIEMEVNATSYTKYSKTFTVPGNARYMQVFGYVHGTILKVDDYSLMQDVDGTPTGTVTKTCKIESFRNCNGASAGYSAWFNILIAGAGNGAQNEYNTSNLEWKEYSDNTATIKGTISKKSDPTVVFTVDMFLSGRTTSGNGHFSTVDNTTFCVGQKGPDWYFYPNAVGTLKGTGTVVGGSQINVTLDPSMPFQVGTGGTTRFKDSFGASAWVELTVVKQPTSGKTLTIGTQGTDFYLEMPGCTPVVCNNVTSGGTIGSVQSGCSGFDPAAFTSVANPSGGSANALEIVWLKSTTATTLTTANASQWTTINGATGLTYDSGPLTQTTSFIRCSRRAGCTDYVGESNVITVTISGTCCSNVTAGGTIAANQSGCSGFDPEAFTSVASPTGGTGALEYVWLRSTTATTLTSANQSEWFAIAGATGATYDAGPLTKTTAYIRCSRRAGCSDYVGESNIIIVTINTNCGGKDPICISRKTPILNNVLCGSTTNYGLFFSDLKGNVATPSTLYSVKSGELTEFCDGTAILNYTACVNGGGANDCITVNLNLSGRTGTPPANSPVTNTHCDNYTPNVNDWYYYPTSNGTFSGTGIYVGLAGTYTQNMGAFQVGTGGNLNEISKFGASSWFFINITNGGTNNWSTVSKKGDINVGLGTSSNIASVTAKANPTSICKGESVALTATLDANSKSANCSPTYSWVGSNGFTSNQATVTNTNVQGATTYTVTVTFTAANGSKCSVTATTGVALNAVCCDNVTNGGQISASQSGCAPFDPAPFTSVAAPSGGSGAAEYLWLRSTTATTFTADNMNTEWFAVVGGTNATLDVGPLTRTTAYIRCSRRAGCADYVGESNIIIVTVNPTPAAPTVTGATFCGTSTATLTATCAAGSTPNWYTALTGGSAVATGTSYTTPSISANTSYYVTCKSTAGCESTPRTEVTATVNPNPNAPTVTPGTSCGNGSVTLGAVCASGSTAQWYAAATGGNSLATGASYTTTSLSATTTFYVSCKTGLGCESGRTPVKATVIAKITDGGKIQSNEDICPGKTPALITSVTPASGGDASLAIEYIWLKTTSLTNGVCPQNIVGQNLYTEIPGSTSANYQPGAITQTTCYIRCARRAGCTDYIGGESNIVKKTLLASCQGKDPVCISRKTPVLNNILCGSTTNYGLFFSDLKGNVATPSTLYSVKSGELTEFCDGTAVLSYVACVNGGGANDCITTTVNFSGRTGTPPAGSPVTNTHCSNYIPNVSDWYYYPTSNGTFTGTGIYAGLIGTYTQNMGAFQVGTGGSLNEVSKFGASSWFKINITNGGTNNWSTVSKDGDINVNLGTSTNIASVTASANPTAICSGENVNLTATLDANSKSANCSPSYSWVGSNGFTSTQATVTNNNVTASTTYTVTVTFTAANGSKCSVMATTGVTVNPTPATPTVTPAAICGTGTVTLKATCATGATAQWYTAATGGTVIATGPSYTTPSISATTPYFVSCKSPEGCLSARVEVKATINANGVMPTVKPAAICGTGTVTLGATCSTGSTAQWYSVATGGSVIATGSSYTTPSISATTTYYVSCKTTEGCESARAEVKATVNPIPAVPTVTPALNCGNGSVTLGAVCATGSTAQWYAAATGGSTLTTGASYVTPTLSTTTSYYVSCKTPESCESARVEVKATIIAKITSGGTIKADEIICVGATPSKIVNVTLPSGGDANLAIEYLWLKTTSLTATGACPANIAGQTLYTPIPGANQSEYQPGAITQTTCYIRCSRRAGCTDYDGESNIIKKTTEAFPAAPTVTPAAICGTGTVTLGATCTNGSTAQWYTTATGGTVVATGASYTTPSISATTSYYVLCKSPNAGCESARTEVKATVNPIPAAPSVTPKAICGTGTVTLGATCTTGTAQWYAAATGGSAIATGASYTTPSISTTTSYFVSCKTTEGCESGRTEVKAVINPIPAAPTVKGAAICGTGTVTLGATCTTGVAQWYAAATGGSSIATGASYTTPSISATTSYYVSCKTTEGCESGRTEVKATINPIPAAPTVKGAAICGTGTVTLGATCTTGVAQWYAAATGGSAIATGASYTTPSISATTSYYVSCKTTEGCESGRTEVKATINPIPAAPTVKGDAICGTGTVTLGATCLTGTAQWYAAATGGSSIATGASYTTPSISSTTSYYVSCKTIEGCESGRTEVKATINPIPAAPTVKGDAICGTGTVTLGATCTTGTAQWYAAATGGSAIATGASYTTPSISSTTSYYVSCKTTEGCESGRTEVKAVINPIPAAPTVKGAAICGTGTVTLGATCTTGVAQWYTAATGGSAISTGASYTTPSISATTSYYVSCKTTEGCESGRTEVKATINPIPAAPTVKGAAICGTGTVTLGATCTTGVAQWYAAATGGSAIATGASYTTPSISATTSYYVSCKTTEGCESGRTEVKATINPIPAAPTVKGAAICGTGTVTLGATCTTGVAQWYAAATGGSAIATGASYTTPSISSTTSYFVSCKTTEGCESGRTEVKATINPIPAAPTVKGAAICGTGTVTLGATCTTGVAQWYAAATGGSSIATGASYTTPSISATTSYYVSCKTTEGCESGRTEVKATINPIPAAPTVKGDAICGTGTVTLGATCTTGVAQWYAAATGGSAIATRASYTTPSISATTSYYVSCKTTEGCESGRTEVKATVNANPVAPTVTPATNCGNGSVTLGAACSAATPTWYSTATGGSSIASGTSYTTPTLSTTTSYYVSCKSSAGCESARTEVKATIIGKITDGGTIKADEIICVGATPSKIVNVTLPSGGDANLAIEYLWLKTTSLNTDGSCPQNIVGQNLYTPIPGATSSEYQPGAITQTTCYIRCSRRAGCTDYDGESNVIKKATEATAAAPTVTPAAICGTGTVTLKANCTTGIANWYAAATGGSAIATGASFTTPSISATTSYYVSCKSANAGCESARVEVKATINAIPAAPTVKGDAICGTGTVTLGATCTSGVAQWYAAATGGSAIATGASYTTPSISTTTSYYVSCKSAEGCESGRTEVKATVNANAAAPTVTPAAICGTGTVTLGATCTSGIAQWYAAATGGSAIATGASYTTPSISATTSYFVSCKSSAGCESGRTEVKATINVIPAAPTVKGAEICGTGTVTLGATCTTGTANWYAAATGGSSIATGASYTTPSISTTTSYYVSCKSTEGCESGRTEVKATINANAAAPTVKGDAICGTGTVTLGATCTSGIAQWYAAATGGSAIATGASYTTPSISATTSYFVSCKSNAGCESERVEVKAMIRAIPNAPTVTPAAICGTGTVTLGATCTTGTATWYAVEVGVAVLATGPTYNTPILDATRSYYVSCKSNAGCESARVEVKATVNANATAPTVTPAAICGTGTVTLGATCTSGTAQWYAAATGGSAIATGASYTTPSISATTSYFVSCKSSAGCESARTEVKATINAIPASPTVKGDAICGTGTVTLGATCTTGTANWYAAATGGSAIATGASYTTPSISATTSYYVSCKSSAGCESGRTEVKATINSGGTAPTVTPATSCGNGTVTLGATCTSGTAQWYAAATGGSAIATGASFTTPTLSATTSYYVSCKTAAGCESARTEVKATIIGKITDGGTIKADETLCGSGTPAKITNVTLPTGGSANAAIEYIWLKTTSLNSDGSCPQNIVGQTLYTPIPGSTSSEYQPGAITQTTCYIRCSRRAGCTDYDGESNIVKKAISNPFTVTATANPTSTCVGGTVNITSTTTATGTVTYSWKGPDGFSVSTKDVTLTNVTKSGVYTVTVSNGSCSAVATVQVTVKNCLKLGDTVFNDKNNNGKQDGGESAIPGVTVKLYNAANVLVGTTTTDPVTGKYLFTDLAPGDYTVEIVAPAGYKSSTGTNGSATGTYEPAPDPDNNVDGDDNGSLVSGQIIRSKPVTLTTTDNLTVDFGLFKPASIGDYVFRDLNGDGKQDAGEGGVSGVKVNLYDSANNLVATVTTGSNGKYLFDNLVAGNYTVEFVKSTLASGFNFSPAGTTTSDKDSDANVTTGRTGTITLSEGQNRTDIDAGVTTPCDTDKTPPVLSACPSDILIKTRGTVGYASWIAPTATDNCGTPVVTTTNESGSAFPVGSTTVTYTATDAKGNKTTCSFVVNVVKIITCDVDTQAPVFYDCPTDIVVTTTGTSSVVYWDHPAVGDNCGIPSVSYNFEPGSTFPVGVTTVSYIAKDAKGNTSTCTFKITVTKRSARTAAVTAANPEKVASEGDVNVENQVSIYPNPSSNLDVAVELSADLMRANSSVEVNIVGMTGNSHFSQTASGTEAVSVKVPVTSMPAGTYFVNVGLDNGRMIIKKLQIIK